MRGIGRNLVFASFLVFGNAVRVCHDPLDPPVHCIAYRLGYRHEAEPTSLSIGGSVFVVRGSSVGGARLWEYGCGDCLVNEVCWKK